MKVAVLGAGVAGLVAARRLTARGCEVDVYERWPGLGGQAATLPVGGGHLLERYYHHWFTSDRHIVELCEELGLGDQVEWRESSVAFFAEGRAWPFSTPLDLLRFGPLSPLQRVRMGLAVLLLQKLARGVAKYEGVTARAWVERAMGKAAWQKVWGPLLRGKFGDRAEDISMAWLYGKFTQRRQLKGAEARTEMLGYPRESFEPLFNALRHEIETGGGRVHIDRPAVRVSRFEDGFLVWPGRPGSFRAGHDPRSFEAEADPQSYDAVLATVPNDVFEQLLDPELAAEIGDDYLGRMRSVEYHTALCLLLELDRPFGPFYWTNIAEPEIPFVGLVEHTNLVGAERYDGRRFLYVANYVAAGDPLLKLDADELLAVYEPSLRRVNPGFRRDWVRERWLHREPAGQPIVTVGYHEQIPPLRTPVPGLILANTTQIYPEDRGTSYSVRLGEDAAATLVADVVDK